MNMHYQSSKFYSSEYWVTLKNKNPSDIGGQNWEDNGKSDWIQLTISEGSY
jgi:hypothetical protein